MWAMLSRAHLQRWFPFLAWPRPNATLLPVDRWVEPAEFEALEEEAREIGYSGVLSGPLVRSSYRAGRLYRTAMDARKKTSTTEK